MNKIELLTTLQTARAEWDDLIRRALHAEADGTRPPYTEGEYSLKDVIAHVTWYERETVIMLKARSLDKSSPNWRLPTVDDRNAAVYAEIHPLTLESVLAQSKEVYQQLVEVVKSLADDEIEDASKFNMPWPPSRVVSGNAYDHYYQHIPLIRAWLDKS